MRGEIGQKGEKAFIVSEYMTISICKVITMILYTMLSTIGLKRGQGVKRTERRPSKNNIIQLDVEI